MPVFEAINAEYGDCLMIHYEIGAMDGGPPIPQLWLIDGGPTATYKTTLAPRLRELAQERDGKLNIRLGVVTHIDDDHIDGMAALAQALVQSPRPDGTPDVVFQEFWFNGFTSIFGSSDTPIGGVASLASANHFDQLTAGLSTSRIDEARMFLQGVADGERLLGSLASFKSAAGEPLVLNARFGDAPFQKAVAPRTFHLPPLPGPTILVLTPTAERLDALKSKWQEATKSTALLQALLRGKIDSSVANLSSISFFATVLDCTMLLTGDGLAEDIVAGWQIIKGDTDAFPIDLMKVPHHGSQANNSDALFALFPARHYVFCANGRHDNPDMWTLESLFRVRQGGAFTIHLTTPRTNPAIAAQVAFLTEKTEASGGQIQVVFLDPNALSVKVEL